MFGTKERKNKFTKFIEGAKASSVQLHGELISRINWFIFFLSISHEPQKRYHFFKFSQSNNIFMESTREERQKFDFSMRSSP
jgi:hypothetical protein